MEMFFSLLAFSINFAGSVPVIVGLRSLFKNPPDLSWGVNGILSSFWILRGKTSNAVSYVSKG
jgi:hypothetical protein